MSVLRTFTVRDLAKIAKRLDRVTEERAEQRTDAVERQNRRLRQLLRRKPSA